MWYGKMLRVTGIHDLLGRDLKSSFEKHQQYFKICVMAFEKAREF
jgi:hypothetical protein